VCVRFKGAGVLVLVFALDALGGGGVGAGVLVLVLVCVRFKGAGVLVLVFALDALGSCASQRVGNTTNTHATTSTAVIVRLSSMLSQAWRAHANLYAPCACQSRRRLARLSNST
jgi:ABC-type uncharacterized transport system permease subunit